MFVKAIFNHKKVTVFICAWCIFFLDIFIGLGFFRSTFNKVFVVFLHPTTRVFRSFQNIIDWVEFSKTGVTRIEDLERRNAELIAKVAEAEYLKQENELLKQEIEGDTKHSVVENRQAYVTYLLPSGTQYKIPIGKKHGIKKNDMVFAQGVLVGKVVEVGEEISEVILLQTRESFRLQAETLQGVQGVVELYKGEVDLRHVGVDRPLQEGDMVYTQGSESIPKGLYIGTIQSVQRVPSQIEQEAILDQGINVLETEMVVVKGF